MTDMKRVTISIPEDMSAKVFELRKNDAYLKCSYSEIFRKLLELGLDVERKKTASKEHRAG